MRIEICSDTIPGTVLKKESMENVTGREFLDKIFFISNGVMLSQIKEISGLDGSTLQNWIKRGWVGSAVNKRYSKDQLARILIINMMRKSMQLERIDFLLRYINGNLDCREDDIIPESELYGYICALLELIEREDACGGSLRDNIEKCAQDYSERIAGARLRLINALEIIVCSYYSSLIQLRCDDLYADLAGGVNHGGLV